MNDELFGIRDILGFVPYIGDALDIADVGKDINKGNYGKAAIGLGLLAVPNIIEKPLKLIGKKAIKRLSGAEKLDIPKGERKSPSPYLIFLSMKAENRIPLFKPPYLFIPELVFFKVSKAIVHNPFNPPLNTDIKKNY